MIINKAEKLNFLSTEEISTLNSSVSKTEAKKSYDVVSMYQDDPFVSHLSTPITTSNLTRTYLSLLPAYKTGLSPLLRGIYIGCVHGYLLVGPFIKLGPLRNSEVATYIGFISAISLIIILTTCLFIYGFVTFSETKKIANSSTLDFQNPKGWNQFTSGFIVGGFGGASIAFVLVKLLNF